MTIADPGPSRLALVIAVHRDVAEFHIRNVQKKMRSRRSDDASDLLFGNKAALTISDDHPHDAELSGSAREAILKYHEGRATQSLGINCCGFQFCYCRGHRQKFAMQFNHRISLLSERVAISW